MRVGVWNECHDWQYYYLHGTHMQVCNVMVRSAVSALLESNPPPKYLWHGQGPWICCCSSGRTRNTQSSTGLFAVTSSSSVLIIFWREMLLECIRVYMSKDHMDSSWSRIWMTCMVKSLFLLVHPKVFLQWVMRKHSLTSAVYWANPPLFHTADAKLSRSSNFGIKKSSLGPLAVLLAPASKIANLCSWNSFRDNSILVMDESIWMGIWDWYMKSMRACIAWRKLGGTTWAIMETMVCWISWCSCPVICLICETLPEKCLDTMCLWWHWNHLSRSAPTTSLHHWRTWLKKNLWIKWRISGTRKIDGSENHQSCQNSKWMLLRKRAFIAFWKWSKSQGSILEATSLIRASVSSAVWGGWHLASPKCLWVAWVMGDAFFAMQAIISCSGRSAVHAARGVKQ